MPEVDMPSVPTRIPHEVVACQHRSTSITAVDLSISFQGTDATGSQILKSCFQIALRGDVYMTSALREGASQIQTKGREVA